jgi:hypothetical protein
MQEGVRNSGVVIAIITPACADPDRPDDGPESNAYFARDLCVQELRWAREAGVPIQPVIRSEDKKRQVSTQSICIQACVRAVFHITVSHSWRV